MLDFARTFVNIEFVDKIKNPLFTLNLLHVGSSMHTIVNFRQYSSPQQTIRIQIQDSRFRPMVGSLGWHNYRMLFFRRVQSPFSFPHDLWLPLYLITKMSSKTTLSVVGFCVSKKKSMSYLISVWESWC